MAEQDEDNISFFDKIVSQCEDEERKEREAQKEIEALYEKKQRTADDSDDSIDIPYLDPLGASSPEENMDDVMQVSEEDKQNEAFLQEASEAAETDIEQISFPVPRSPKRETWEKEPRISRPKLKQKVKKNPPGPWTCLCGKHDNKYMYCSICGRYWEEGAVQVSNPENKSEV